MTALEDVARGLNDIASSKLSFAKEALPQAGKAITPFIPLIGLAANAIVGIIDIYHTSQYNKRICNSLIDRARLSEIAIDQLIRRRKENEKNFRNRAWYNAFNRFVVVLTRIKDFAEKVSQLQGIIKFPSTKNIEEEFNKLIEEYDNVMKDLNFTMAIANEQQRQIDLEGMKDDLYETNKFLEKIGDNIEADNVKMSLLFEEVQNIRLSVSNPELIEPKRIDSGDLTKPVVGSDMCGSWAKKRMCMNNAIEVFCRVIAPKDEYEPGLTRFQRCLAVYEKVTQLPNIIQFYGLSTIYNNHYTVMVSEWAELGSLEDLYTDIKIPLNQKISYALDICRGVAYLNALNYYHDDLRCKNVMVTANNIAKLTNFNLSHVRFPEPESFYSILEKIRWLAPEELKDDKSVIFSFGMLLWELVFERKPYQYIEYDVISSFVISGGREETQFDQICLSTPASPASSDTEIKEGLEKIIKEAWKQDPDARINISKLLIGLDDLANKFIKPDHSLIPPCREITDINILKSNGIPEDKGFNSIEPMIPIDKGLEAHNGGDYEKAWKCFNEQAENQNGIGKYWKAYYLFEGCYNKKMDKVTALKLYKEAADDGIVDAQYRYACTLLDRDLRPQFKINPSEAVKYLQMAAHNGSAKAQLNIGEACFKGRLGYEKDSETAKIWYKRAALQGDKEAKTRLKALG